MHNLMTSYWRPFVICFTLNGVKAFMVIHNTCEDLDLQKSDNFCVCVTHKINLVVQTLLK